MPFVTFEKKQSARTGNIIFQYLISKVISIEFDREYIPIEEIPSKDNVFFVNEENAEDFLNHKIDIGEQNIICDGFFQKDSFYLPRRDVLLKSLYRSEIIGVQFKSYDYWYGCHGEKQYIDDLLYCSNSYDIGPNDVVVSLRLDDFIQLPRETSDIIPPEYYLNILESISFDKLYIVCDTIRHDWEHNYIEFFNKWNPILIQKDLLHDCAVMRECPRLLHSNSTLCWIMSFFSKTKNERYIPKTNFYGGQSLNQIEKTDVLQHVKPLSHHAVYNLNQQNYLKQNIYPLSYCIPDECIITDKQILDTEHREFQSQLVPGERSTYIYGDDEEYYNENYQKSTFAYTMKKGGWDCLRHYEIMANGCIPCFMDGTPPLENCPKETLINFPKELVKEAKEKIWDNFSKSGESRETYVTMRNLIKLYQKNIVEHTRKHCSTSGTIRYFFSKMPQLRPKNVLLIRGNCGVNYTRETFWIGMKRFIQSFNGVAIEYPKIDYLYKNYQGEKKNLYGNGFTYSCRLEDDFTFTDEEIIQKIDNKFFDLIIYGKVGPDEDYEGSLPNMPLWNHVFKKYNKNQIVFLYGGDECINCTSNNRYNEHIMYHSQFAHCFVRELRI